jgi:hypothetical protein
MRIESITRYRCDGCGREETTTQDWASLMPRNGQHRIEACIRAGVPFKCFVVFGVEEDAFNFMDRGIARTAAHIFDIEKIPNAINVAAAARL